MFIIGIDPHKGSHTAAVIDDDEQVVDELLVRADRRQRERLLGWAAAFTPRVWAVEGATGVGALLAQQLVGAGETVVDVPPALSARVRLLDAGRQDKTDEHDARATAIVALRHKHLHAVVLEDHRQVLRRSARRHHQLIAGRTRPICRLHAVLCEMIEGGLSKNLSAKRAALELRKLRPTGAIAVERKHLAVEFLDEVRRHDRALVELQQRIITAVRAADTTVTDIHGIGPIVACYLIGYSGDICRFPSAGHYARYNATAPIEASSGPKTRHRLNPNGNRQLNHEIHIAALGQISHDTPGRAYYFQKQTEGEVTQGSDALLETTHQRRGLSTATRRRRPLNEAGSGRTIRGDTEIQRGRQIPEHRHFGEVTPEPDTNATTLKPRAPRGRPSAAQRPSSSSLLTQTGFALARLCHPSTVDRVCRNRGDDAQPDDLQFRHEASRCYTRSAASADDALARPL